MTGPYDLTTHDGNKVDWITKAALLKAEHLLGYELTITQGSYNAGQVSASAGTHDGGGVVDLAPWDWANKVRVLRKVGFAAWHRLPSQGPWPEHIHAVLIGNSKLSGSASRQVSSYLAGRNGLANNAADDGPRDYVHNHFTWTGVPTSELGKPLRVDGVDISHFQDGKIDYAAAKDAGVQWLYHKASEGSTWTDDNYARRRKEAKAAGLPFGAYHFARPNKGDADVEAGHFLDFAKPEVGDLVPMLDLEDTGGLTKAELTLWVRTFVRNIEKALGVLPLIYTSFDLDDNFGCLLWAARYNNDNDPPRVPAPWNKYSIRQFSNGVDGVPNRVAGFGNVDLNKMHGTLTVGELLISPPVVVVPDPEPKPTPEPPAPDLPPHDPFFAAIVPGKWNAPEADWVRRHQEAHAFGAQLITMTEGTRVKLVAALTRDLAGLQWGVFHDPTPGPANIIHTWDLERFNFVGRPWIVQLEDDTTYTKGGVLQPNSYAVGIALEDRITEQVLLVLGAHLPLENTPNRVASKEQALLTLRTKGFDEGRAQFPEAATIILADWNRPANKQSVRDWFTSWWPRLTAAWAKDKHAGPDWIAVGSRLVVLDSQVLPREDTDPLDHTTKVTQLGWRSK